MRPLAHLCSCLMVWSIVSTLQAAEYTVSTSGNDANAGTLHSPWKTLTYGVSRLAPGDVLTLQEGVYYEADIPLRGKGTPERPIRIEGASGATVTIDASMPDFRGNTVGICQWEPYDMRRGIYRSKKRYSTELRGDLIAVWGSFEWKGVTYQLIPYKTYDSLAYNGAENDGVGRDALRGIGEPYYMGPGVFGSSKSGIPQADGYLYIRLTPPSLAAMLGRSTASGFTEATGAMNPCDMNVRIARPNATTVFIANGTPASVQMKNLSLRSIERGIAGSFRSSSFTDIMMTPGLIGLSLSDSQNVTVNRLSVDGRLPPWLAWGDVKNQDTPGERLKTACMALKNTESIAIENSTLRNCFDGIIAVDRSRDVKVLYSQFDHIWDDGIQLGAVVKNIEISHNVFLGAGVSHDGEVSSGMTLEGIGTKYFHHNIFDNSSEILWGRQDPSSLRTMNETGWRHPILMSQHGASGLIADPWKIYSNTFVISPSYTSYVGLDDLLVNNSSVPHELYNNIFIARPGIESIFRSPKFLSGLTKMDGNLYYRQDAKTKVIAALEVPDARLEVKNPDTAALGAENFTVSVWIRLPKATVETPERQEIISRFDGAKGYRLQVINGARVSGSISFGSGSTEALSVFVDKPLDDNTWHHVAWIVERSSSRAAQKMSILIDGTLAGSRPVTSQFMNVQSSPETPLLIGKSLMGDISDLQIFPRRLTDDALALARNDPTSIASYSAYWNWNMRSDESGFEDSSSGDHDAMISFTRKDITYRTDSRPYGSKGIDANVLMFQAVRNDRRDFLSIADLKGFLGVYLGTGSVIAESQGLDGNPGLGADYVPSLGSPALTPGVSLATKRWPGTDATIPQYRGALGPKVPVLTPPDFFLTMDSAQLKKIINGRYEPRIVEKPTIHGSALALGVKESFRLQPQMSLTGKSITFSVWAWQQGDSGSEKSTGILTITNPNGSLSVGTSPSGEIVAVYRPARGATLQLLASGALLTRDQWHHIAVVQDSTSKTVTLYVDGQKVATGELSSLFQHTSTTNYILGRWGKTFFGSGYMDELKTWNSALSSSQISQVYTAGNPVGR